MSIFNPFKAHIAATNNQGFCVRKLSITAFGWIYLDAPLMEWRLNRHFLGCRHSLEEARAVLAVYKTFSLRPDTWYIE